MAGRPKRTKQKFVDRERMWSLYLEGYSRKQIAEILGHHPGTIERLIAERKSWEELKGM